MVAKMHVIETELLKATKQKAQGAKEDRNEFLTRVAQAVNDDVSATAFKKLSEEATAWYENVVAAAEGGAKSLPDYNVEEKKKFSIGSKGKAPAAKGKAPAKEEKKAKVKIGKAPAAKKETKARDKKPMRWENAVKDKVGYRSMIDAVRHIICAAPKFTITFEAMQEKLEARGFTKANEFRLYANYIHVNGVIAMLQELGKL